MGRPKGIPATPQECEAGARNLAKWKAENPSGGRLSHGAYSKVIHQRYSNHRYREAKQLRCICNNLISDVGGESCLTEGQRICLGKIRTYLIVLLQISDFVGKQESVLDQGGNLLPCLGRGFTTYGENLRREVQSFYEMANKKPERVPTIDEVMKSQS